MNRSVNWFSFLKDLFIYFDLTYIHVFSLLLSSENIYGTKPFEWGTQWDLNSLIFEVWMVFSWLWVSRHQLYGHLPPITKTIQGRRTRQAGHAGEARTNSLVIYSYGPPHMAKQKQDDQLEHTYSSYVRIRDVALRTCQKRWMIGKSDERGSGISVLAAWHDDDAGFI